MYDVLIIGAGPAGISAALYAKRAGSKVLILYHGQSNLEKAEKIDNYYGFENGIEGKVLYQIGIKQAQNLGVELKMEEVLDIEKDNQIFTVETIKNKYKSKSVIIATGNKRLRPDIEGIIQFEGKGISYCAVCDGFFYKNKNVAVIGSGNYALKEAENLKNIANKIILLTNGQSQIDNIDYEINKCKIKQIYGEERVLGVEFEDGNRIPLDGIFIAIGEAGAADFAKKLGLMINGNSINVDNNMKTSIDGIYSCGDSTGELFQICKAVNEGSIAGISATKYIKKIGGK